MHHAGGMQSGGSPLPQLRRQWGDWEGSPAEQAPSHTHGTVPILDTFIIDIISCSTLSLSLKAERPVVDPS